MSSVVRPEFGPTLPEILGPPLRRAPRWLQVLLALAVAAVIVAAAVLLLGRDDGRASIVVRGPTPFNLVYQPGQLERVAPQAGEELRLQTPAGTANPASVAVGGVRLPAYRGDASGILPIYASGLIDQMQRTDPHFVLRSEGRARVNDLPGYQIQFQTAKDGRTYYGRRALLFPDEPGVRDGADVTLLAARSAVVPNADGVGSNGTTKLPYRSFRLGTERP